MSSEGLRIPDLERRVVVITGAGRGIGAAAARGFANVGARVVLHCHRSTADAEAVADGIRASGGDAWVMAEDFLDPGAAQRLIARVLELGHGLDVLVNNAGAMLERRRLKDLDDVFIDRVFNLNARAVVGACQAAAPALQQSQGSIINVSSISARTGGSAGSSIYSGVKAFVSTFTRSLASELAPVRVNAVSPGTVMTDFHRAYSTPEKLEKTRWGIPLQRLGIADDCTGTFLYLASRQLSGYVTGQVVEVNGGQLMA
ncbi:MAG: SDR family oxidoreductase [Ectothiorhodospiraceae bacterium]|nr:SDR family oxidoreductase [Ectothiorhodospiraceae bacterium]MCH8504472.1 SDR family oxidoreductase [Ectothiorhodospiraceae bacterium]